MDRHEFAQHLGFNSVEALSSQSTVVYTQGDIDWYITPLPDGRWAAWDDAELAPDRVEYRATRNAAIEHHITGAEIAHGANHVARLQDADAHIEADCIYQGEDIVGYRLVACDPHGNALCLGIDREYRI